MTDIFRTGFEMDTSDLKKGSSALDDVAKSADKADKSIDELDKTTKKTDETFEKTTITAEEFAKALDIDVNDFDASQKSILSGLNKSGKAFEMASLKVDRFAEDQRIVGNVIDKNGKVLDKNGNEVLKLTRRWSDLQKKLKSSKIGFDTARKSAKNLTTGVASAKKGFGLAGNSAQMLGYQLQDVAVQAQMGASWFTIVGQQGSQLASVLGSKGALLGAVIAIGSALGGVLFKAMGNVKINADEMREAIDATTESIKLMDAVTKTFLAKEEQDNVKELENQLNNLNNKIKDTEESLVRVDKSRAFTLARKDLKDAPQTLEILLKNYTDNSKKYQKELVDLRKKAKDLNDQIAGSAQILKDITQSEDIGKYYQNSLEVIKLTSKAEQEKWNAIQAGVRERKKELETLKQIELSSNAILAVENNTREAAIKKGKAQEVVLKNSKTAAFESQLESLRDFGKSETDIENERYKQSIEMLKKYAEEKGWLDSKIKDTELLLQASHNQKLLDIDKESLKKRAKEGVSFLDNAQNLSNVFNDITTVSTSKRKAALQNDLSNSEKFSAAEIAIKDKELRAIFEKEKSANLKRIAINTAVSLSESLTNPAKFLAVGLAGAAQLAAASAVNYGGGGVVASGSPTPPSVGANTTNNNSGGNIINLNISNNGGGQIDAESIQEYFKDGGILFDQDSEQAGILR